MIFASVGSMLPFDRLVQAVDEWAQARRADEIAWLQCAETVVRIADQIAA